MCNGVLKGIRSCGGGAMPLTLVKGLVYLADMKHYTVHEAKTHLSRLLRRAEAGEEVVITRSGLPVARLAPVYESRRSFGQDRGHFVVPDDFDAPLDEELLRAFEGGE